MTQQEERICTTFLLLMMPEIEGEVNTNYDSVAAGILWHQHRDLLEAFMDGYRQIVRESLVLTTQKEPA